MDPFLSILPIAIQQYVQAGGPTSISALQSALNAGLQNSGNMVIIYPANAPVPANPNPPLAETTESEATSETLQVS